MLFCFYDKIHDQGNLEKSEFTWAYGRDSMAAGSWSRRKLRDYT